MTWTTFRSRGEVLRTVIATANTRRDGVLPADVEGVAEFFADDLDLIATLQLKWHTRLAGHIERELVAQPLDLPRAVATAWCAATDELPGVRLVLDRQRVEPATTDIALALGRATTKEHALLAVMAGQAGVGDDAVAAPFGARIEHHAREMHRTVPAALRPVGVDDDAPAAPQTFLERLRSVLAA